uniref:Uncharacterized protein n=1 Tax=Rousettus aegyptiacus TaxID=9407 RepID=A0A7J8E8H1_ROUAE|nr:hypothetical protein HJG63_008186 [Rousettus aegyptiacus]
MPVIRLLYAGSKITLPDSVILALISTLPAGFLKVLRIGCVAGLCKAGGWRRGLFLHARCFFQQYPSSNVPSPNSSTYSQSLALSYILRTASLHPLRPTSISQAAPLLRGLSPSFPRTSSPNF